MGVLDLLKSQRLYLDGGFGTFLQKEGLKPGEHTESWNISHPAVVQNVHRKYYDAGSNIVCANTFGANSLNFSDNELEAIIKAAFENVRSAAEQSFGKQEKFSALDIGPLGKLLKPFGDFDFEDAVSVFAKTVRLGVKYGADLIVIETMNDSYETKAALLAVKENSTLPVFVTNAYSEDGKLMTGATPEAMVAMLEGMGADAIGANCSLGPKQLESVAKKIIKAASVPVIMKPNAGMPKSVDGKTVFDVNAGDFSDEMVKFAMLGVNVLGGCCGTDDEYIRLLVQKTKYLPFTPNSEKKFTVVSSYTHAVTFGARPVLIGERINPTGKKRFKQALLENDIGYILREGLSEQQSGAHVLDVNVGIPGIDEADMLKRAVFELQSIIDLPMQLDTSDIIAMEGALRLYNGKAMINSVNGKEESMRAVFPLVKKYGGVVVALTLDENGIPKTVDERVRIAEKILRVAAEYGIKRKDIVFDTLAMAVSAEPFAAQTTLGALKTIREELCCNTVLGVSNVSFGLPNRGALNASFFLLALENGLSAGIINPLSRDMMSAYKNYCALKGFDEGFFEYIDFCSNVDAPMNDNAASFQQSEQSIAERLKVAIEKGLKGNSSELCKTLLGETGGLEIVNNIIIPALDEVGKGFEQKKIYLPQLLMSAEAAKCAFEQIKLSSKDSTASSKVGFPVVLATVKGDVHDIGKNIVKLLLENYGYDVLDLGKDVPKEKIAEAVCRSNAPIAGLSALMTTTVPAMEETIELLRKRAPNCKVVVGGAVLTEEYAKKIGADKYSADAMETVRYAERLRMDINRR